MRRRESKPIKHSLAMFFVIIEIANIDVPIGINFDAMAMFSIINKFPFIDLALLINQNPITISLL